MHNEQLFFHNFPWESSVWGKQDCYNLQDEPYVFSSQLAFADLTLFLDFLISFPLTKCLCHGQIQVNLVSVYWLTTLPRNSVPFLVSFITALFMSFFHVILHLLFYSILSIGHMDIGRVKKGWQHNLLKKSGVCILKTSNLPIVGPKKPLWAKSEYYYHFPS